MEVHIAKWGNSAAVRLPKAVLDYYRLAGGDACEVILEADGIKLKPQRPVQRATRRYSLDQLCQGMTPGNAHPSWDDGPMGEEAL
jgi:antitoxin MazE